MNVLYCGDDKAYLGIELSMYSLLFHNKNVNVYVFTMHYTRPDGVEFKGLSDWQKNKLKKIVKYLDPNGSTITFVDVKEYYEKYLKNGANEYHPLTPMAPLRLFVAKALPDINDILYLDADTAVQEDIHGFYATFLDKVVRSDYCYAAYKNPIEAGVGEMVSGVMILDLYKCRKSGFFDNAIQYVHDNKFKWYDQDGIAMAGDCVPIPDMYSYMQPLEEATFKPAILHFTNKLSPKIYTTTRAAFYNRYPDLKYVKDGCELIDTINF